MKREEAIAQLRLLVGRNLHELAVEYGIAIRRDGKVNKGWAGHVLERHLELPRNSAQSPNFGSWELKSVPLKRKGGGELVVKETMAVTMIDPVNVCQKEFKDSHLLAKLKKAVVVFRTVGDTVDDPTYVHSIAKLDLEGCMYTQVEADYNLVRGVLQNPEQGFDSLTGKMGVYIQPRTKGQGHGSTSRAFYARKEFLRNFIDL